MHEYKRTILLVEDQVSISSAEKQSLEDYGYRVTVVTTGEAALEVMQNINEIDLILMDIDLGPGKNGVETAMEILNKEDIPVVFLSSHTEPEVVELTERITSYGYVVKPTNITVLDASIKMAFKLFEAKQKEKLKELALRQSEEKFRLLFQNLNTNFALHEIILDEEGRPCDYRFLLVNPAFEKVIGIPASEIVGMTAREIFPETEEYWIEKFGQVALTGKPLHYENYSQELDRYFEMNIYSPQKGQFALIGLDISERRKAEEELKKKNSIFEAFLKNLPVGVFMVEAPSGTPLLANAVALDILGRGILPDATSKNLAEVYKALKLGTEKTYPVEEMPITRGMKGEYSHVDDMLVERPDGTRVRIEINGSPVRDLEGNVWASLVSFQDITKRKESEELLRESEFSLQTHIENSFDVTFTLDSQGVFLFASPSWTRNFGYPTTEILGKPFSEFVHPEDEKILADYLGRAISSGKGGLSPSFRVKHLRGQWIDFIVNGSLFHDSFGGIKYLGIGHDITEALKIQQKILELEAKVASLQKHN